MLNLYAGLGQCACMSGNITLFPMSFSLLVWAHETLYIACLSVCAGDVVGRLAFVVLSYFYSLHGGVLIVNQTKRNPHYQPFCPQLAPLSLLYSAVVLQNPLDGVQRVAFCPVIEQKNNV